MSTEIGGLADTIWYKDDPCPVCGGQLYFHEQDKEEIDNVICHYGYVYCKTTDCGYDCFASYEGVINNVDL